MKKKFLTIISIIALVLGLSATLIACDEGEKIDYSVTVLSPAEEPLSGVTVSWMSGTEEAGSAETDSTGTATASLPAGIYTIALSGQPAGFGYEQVSVSASMPVIELTLTVTGVTYSVTVIDKAGAPAANVTVNWSNGSGEIVATETTNASGMASCELEFGTYTVTLDNNTLPEGNLADAMTVSGNSPSATFRLRNGVTSNYTVTLKSEGGLLFKNQSLMVYRNNAPAGAGKTNDEGVCNLALEAGNYIVRPAQVPEGYSYTPATLTAEVFETEIVMKSEVIKELPAADKRYVIGDIIHNYTFTTPYAMDNGKAWSKTVSEILEEKEVLLINNWGTNCYWCVEEMPAMQKLYDKYGTQIEIVAVNNYGGGDSDAVITNYCTQNGITFPMMRDDAYNLAYKFGVTGWPTTIVIDRYGAIARIEAGAITSEEAWERMILKYIGNEYVQTFTPGVLNESINTEIAKPDIVLPADHYDKLAEAIGDQEAYPEGTTVKWYPYPEGQEKDHEYAWPFLHGKAGDLGVANDTGTPLITKDTNVVYASNGKYLTAEKDESGKQLTEEGKANSMAILYADVTVDAGKVLTFDYYADTEEDSDIFYLLWDGRIIREISGDSKGWQTCYFYSEISKGKHTLALTYMKNGSGNAEGDNVYLANLRFVGVNEINKPTDMLRGAAYGEISEGAQAFPYYANVSIAGDGYYHVNVDKLEGCDPALLGEDKSPLLLVNLLNVTPWSSGMRLSDGNGGEMTPSINELVFAQKDGKYAYDCTFEIDGVVRDYRQDLVRYLTAASASDVPDCVPVNDFLQKLLVNFMAKVTEKKLEEVNWLEACFFYSHYGDQNFVGNPILGLMEETAIPITVGDNTADLTRNMYPFPSTIYSFTPDESAVYKIESFIPENKASQDAAQIWLYDDKTSTGAPLAYCGDTRVTLDGTNEYNFVVYYYLEAGNKYYLSLAFQMSQRGTYEYSITKIGDSHTEFVPCSEDIYNMVLDGNGNWTSEIELRGAIEYMKDEQGYYHATTSPDSTDDYIYLDVTHVTTGALGTVPLNKLVDMFVTDPKDYSKLDYKMFDFSYCVTYTKDGDAVNYSPKVDLTSINLGVYKDYTEILKGYITEAEKNNGLIKINQELVDILTLFIELRLNAVWDTADGLVLEAALENEWLRFCWYNKKHDSTNP